MPAAALTKAQPIDGNNVKRSVLRVIGLSIITSGLYHFYWFFVTKNQLKRELKNDQHIGWQTVGLIVPILNAFILYWLYRDINSVRDTQKLPPFAAVWYVLVPIILITLGVILGIGAIASIIGGIASAVHNNDSATLGFAGAGVVTGLFALLAFFAGAVLEYVFLGLAIKHLNEYWDKRSGGKAVAARFRGGEITIIVVGVLIMLTNSTGKFSTSQNDDVNFDELFSSPAATISPDQSSSNSSSSIDY